MRIGILLVGLLVGLLFLPAWGLTALSAFAALGLPRARWPRAYSLGPRVLVAPLIAGVGFLGAWVAKIVLDSGWLLPLRPLSLPAVVICEQSRQMLRGFSLGEMSPACRVLIHDPTAENCLGFFLELLLLMNLVWIRLQNLQPSWRETEPRPEESAVNWLFLLNTAALAYIAHRVDSLLALGEGPHEIPAIVSFLLATIYILCASSLQLSLYPWRKRRAAS